ncbi:unnamed protein product [Rhizophagus irregularis]|nr:unnamed protein product [Rhizophagus irregularis]
MEAYRILRLSKAKKVFAYLQKLKTISWSKSISNTAIINIAHSYPNLLRLELSECAYISDRAIREIAKSCHRLEHLNLGSYERNKLEHLDIFGCDDVTVSGIHDIARSCPKLKHLDLGNCEMIGNSAIREIARSCSNLKFLGLESCKGISKNVLEKLDRNIKIEWPDSDSDNESNLSDSEW